METSTTKMTAQQFVDWYEKPIRLLLEQGGEHSGLVLLALAFILIEASARASTNNVSDYQDELTPADHAAMAGWFNLNVNDAKVFFGTRNQLIHQLRLVTQRDAARGKLKSIVIDWALDIPVRSVAYQFRVNPRLLCEEALGRAKEVLVDTVAVANVKATVSADQMPITESFKRT